MNLRALIVEHEGNALLANAPWQPYQHDYDRMIKEGRAKLKEAERLRAQDPEEVDS